MATSTTLTRCPACGTTAAGNFCTGCGAPLAARSCTACQAPLSPQARFCHRCGHPAPTPASPSWSGQTPARERKAWLAAGALSLLLLGAIVLKVTGGVSAPAAPDMANAGAGGAGGRGPADGGAIAGPGGGPGGPAPDISRMSPRERFDRLFNRIMTAADQGDTVQIERFLPMALGAYGQLDSADIDARYHAAVLHLQGGDGRGALALADTILAAVPTHLFGYLVRGEAAALAHDAAGAAKARREFLASYATEMRANRVEYLEHEPAIEAFKRDAEKATGKK